MHHIVTLALIFLPFLGLTIVAIIAIIRARKVFLPTSTSTHILAIILPFLTYATLFAVTKTSSHQTLRLTGKASFATRVRSALPSRETVTTVLFILDTVLITLATAALSTPTLTCGLESRWRQSFMAKDESTIRSIQDRLECCGFRSAKDKAWPFPAKGVSAEACVKRFGWERSCEGIWTAEEASVLRMVIVVGVGVAVMKGDFGRFGEGRIVGEEGEEEEGGGMDRFLDEPEGRTAGGRTANRHEQGERLLATE
ncbi:hypothetical protein MMC18_000516 [Xylographa bjoerkii]|nr:hypothetical protein [Xylographa bjoerkii]